MFEFPHNYFNSSTKLISTDLHLPKFLDILAKFLSPRNLSKYLYESHHLRFVVNECNVSRNNGECKSSVL